MAKSKQTFNKKEREKKRRKKRKEKLERREMRKSEKAERGKLTFEEQLSYVDENGNLTNTPPDPTKKVEIAVEDIVLGVPPKVDSDEGKVRLGMVKFFNDDKGYGFIIDKETRETIFVHINELTETITEKDRVEFEIQMGPKGPTAVKVNKL